MSNCFLRRAGWLVVCVGLGMWVDTLAEAEAGPVVIEQQAPEPAELVAMNHKMDTLVIPHVDLQDKPLTDAIEFLREEARRLDTGPEETRGINIFLKLPAVKSGEASPAAALIHLTMDGPTLREALAAVAMQAGMKVKVEPYAVSIVPVSENTERLFTAEAEVPPGFFGEARESRNGDGTIEARVSALEVLKEKGMAFLPGCSAVYLPEKHRLIVRQTAANLDLLKKILGNRK